jgi:hypothetical protein
MDPVTQEIANQLPTSGFLSRRAALSQFGMGIGSLAFATFGQNLGQARTDGSLDLSSPLSLGAKGDLHPRAPQFSAKARAVIHIFLNGGPSHLDTFDPKPLLERYAGKSLPRPNLPTERQTGACFPSPFRFAKYGNSGLEVSELFRETARHADDLCVIRSMKTDLPNHEPALLMMNCGESRQVRPSFGSWVLYGLGSETQNLPGYVALCPGGQPIQEAQNWTSAFLPAIYQGSYLDTRHTSPERLIGQLRPVHPMRVQSRQIELLQKLESLRSPSDKLADERLRNMELAFRMQMEAPEALDLSRESAATWRLYGEGTQARQMVLARRMVERGVRFVQIFHGPGQPWDSHDDLESNHRRLAGEMDRAISGLLTDLKNRGMLDSTLVVWGGEFGRTPTVELPTPGSNLGKLNGRDHNPYGFSMWVAGGGVNPGIVGSTDELGFQAEENPVHVHDLHASLLHQLGFDHEKLIHRHAGRDFRLTDVHGRVVPEITGSIAKDL